MISSGSMMARLLNSLPQTGTVVWIGVRPARRAELVPVASVCAETESGLEGDHYQGKLTGKRQVTLINAEHLVTIASMLGRPEVSPGLLRRNIVVST